MAASEGEHLDPFSNGWVAWDSWKSAVKYTTSRNEAGLWILRGWFVCKVIDSKWEIISEGNVGY